MTKKKGGKPRSHVASVKTRRMIRKVPYIATRIGLPSDPWWEEAFKTGVEKAAAQAALKSLSEAKQEGIIGPKIYEKLRSNYTQKLSDIERRISKLRKEFSITSEPLSRREMMEELTPLVAQTARVESSDSLGAERISDPSQPTVRLVTAPPASRAGGKGTGIPAGPTEIRRSMLSELKSVLSSANSFQVKTPMGRAGFPRPKPSRGASASAGTRREELHEVPPPKEQTLQAASSSSLAAPQGRMQLNRELIEEFKKLRKIG